MTGHKGHTITIARLLIAAFALLVPFLLRDIWLPDGYQSTHRPKCPVVSFPHIGSEGKADNNDAILPLPSSTPDGCLDAPGAENVLVMLKTGATELYQKLPTHFVTTFKCVPHFMVFSDLAQEIADYPVHDAIASVSEEFRDEHKDFELYRKLHQYQREGQDTSNLQGEGWNLDKWKFLPMMHHAFTTAGDNIKWFVIIEADTSLSWTNLLQWLRTMHPREPIYAGAQNNIAGTSFAHGGSGIVISRKAADLLEQGRDAEGKKAFDKRWEQLTSIACCGDEVIARAFLEVGVHLTAAWPIIQGETVASLDWTAHHWCSPAVSWHHVTPTQVDALWQFESKWVREHGWGTPYLYRDVFEHFIHRHVTVNRTKWNNLSKDVRFAAPELATTGETDVSQLGDLERNAVESEDACAEVCMRMHEIECIQWMYSRGRCYMGRVVRFGQSDEREQDHWTSGWIQERLENFKSRFEGCAARWAG